MPIVAEAAAAIRADMTPFNRDLKAGFSGAEKQAQTLGQRIKGALTPGNLLAAGGIAFGVAQVTQLMSTAINDASDLAESMGKVNVVFGDGAEEVEAWADTASTAFGQSKQSALEAAGTYGNLFQAFGLGQEQAQEMSTTLVELAADLASFNNTSVEDALLALRSGLSGETEPLKRYGVALSDVRLKEEALRLGLIETATGTLPVAVKAQASYSLILKDTALAQGDFARTSDGLANQQRILAARLEDVSAEMGEKLLPVVLELVTFLADTGIPVLEEFLDLLDFGDRNSADGIPILEQAEDILNTLGDVGERANDTILGRKDDIVRAAEEMGLSYMEMRDRIRQAMSDFSLSHEEAIGKVLQDQAVLEQAKGWEEYQNQIRGGGPGIDAAAADMADGIPQAMEDAEEAGKEVARRTPGSLAGELRAGIEEYDEAIDELAEVAANSVSDLSERQKIEGILASQELTDALNSDSTRTRLLALELVNDLVSDYELLAPGALGAGQLVNPALQRGILSNLGLAEDAGEAVVDAAGNPLVNLPSEFYTSGAEAIRQLVMGINDHAWMAQSAMYGVGQSMRAVMPFSEPKDPNSPLRGLKKSGAAIVKMLAQGVYDELDTGQMAARALASSLVPSFAPPSLAAAGATPLNQAAGVGPTYIVNVNGVQRTVSTEEEAMQALRDLGAFSEGRLNG